MGMIIRFKGGSPGPPRSPGDDAPAQFNNLGRAPARLMIYGDNANTIHTLRCGTLLHAKILDKSSTMEIDQTVYGRVTGTWTAGFDRL